MYPLYKADIEAGRMTPCEAFDLAGCMSINKLRQLARDLQVPLTRGQIVSSDKKTLIDAICRAALKEKE